MKSFLLLLAFSVSAHAACEIKSCESNYKCAEQAWKSGSETEMEDYTNYSIKNKCNDELRFAALFAEDQEPASQTAKTELPVIEEAPTRLPANKE